MKSSDQQNAQDHLNEHASEWKKLWSAFVKEQKEKKALSQISINILNHLFSKSLTQRFLKHQPRIQSNK